VTSVRNESVDLISVLLAESVELHRVLVDRVSSVSSEKERFSHNSSTVTGWMSSTVLKPILELMKMKKKMESSPVQWNIPQRILERGMIIGADCDRYWAFGGTMVERLEAAQSKSDKIDVLLRMLRVIKPTPAQTHSELLVATIGRSDLEHSRVYTDQIGLEDGLHYLECTLMRTPQATCSHQHISGAYTVIYKMCTQKNGSHASSLYKYVRDLVATMKELVGVSRKAYIYLPRHYYKCMFKYLDRYHVPRHDLASLSQIWDQAFGTKYCTKPHH